MGWFRQLFAQDVFPENEDEIIGAIDPWMLAGAVGSENGTIGRRIGFDLWLDMSRSNWMHKTRERLDHRFTVQQIERTLKNYVSRNIGRDYREILREEERKHGVPESSVLDPGESMTVKVTTPLPTAKQDAP